MIANTIITAITEAGETIDALVFRVLGKQSPAVEQVLAANPNLADRGLFLPRGLEVRIPASADAAAGASNLVQLWT